MLSNKFIMANQLFSDFNHHIPAPYFRRSFILDFIPSDASITICGLGFYKLYINGQDITKGELAPYISNPDQICYYDTYDVKNLLRDGENVIGVLVGNGFQNEFSGTAFDFDKAPFRGSVRMALSFEACDGKNEISFEADNRFLTYPSPIILDGIRTGCHYDARCELPGWNAPGFDDSKWKPAIRAEQPKGEKCICNADPILVREERLPVSVKLIYEGSFCQTGFGVGHIATPGTEYKNGYIYDFGLNGAGVCRLKIRGEKGQRIVLKHTDFLNGDQFSIRSTIFNWKDIEKNLQQYSQTDVYILKGGEEEIFTPVFTYHGFRYVLVLGLKPEQATRDLLTCLVMSSALTERGNFSSSDAVMNELYACVRRSDLANFFYFPTDCPHREKNGYTGDISVSAEHMEMTLTPTNSFRVWLQNVRKCQKESGILPCIVPTAGWGYTWANGPAWDSAIINVPYAAYKFDGCEDIIRENSDMIYRYLHYAMSHADENGLFHFGLGDWSQPLCKQQGMPDTPLVVSDTAEVYDMANKASFLFDVIGENEKKEYAQESAGQVREAFRRELFDSTTGWVDGHTQCGQSIAIGMGLTNSDEYDLVFSRLLETVHEWDDHLHVGMIGLRYIFHVLVDGGQEDLAYRMITRPDGPSYGNWLARGATTLWEAFEQDGDEVESRCHHFFGDIASLFMQKIAGLNYNPKCNDCKYINVQPHFITALQNAEASYNSIYGEIYVGWKKSRSHVHLQIKIPKGIHGRIILPDGWTFEDENTTKPVNDGLSVFILNSKQ